ncbi:MAG: aminomethyl transferase family protein [Chloroflexi bacterium]|nr:aminomethyl transferase family protein [Chloroflexota bacterium]
MLNRGDTVLLLTSPGRAQAVRRWLSGYVFFNDDVRFDDVSDSLAQFCVVGPQAARVAEGAFPGVTAPQENRFLTAQAPGEGAGGEWILLRGRGLAGDGVTLVGPREEAAGVWERLGGAGALPAGEETFQVLRVEAGQGYAGHEISEEYIPLEAGLWPAVSFHKGCYIGQEIIARMESRGKLAKTLVGLKLAAPVAVGDEVRQGERRVGEVSSAVVSPGAGPIALAFVKPDVAEPGTRLTAGDVAAQVGAFAIR